MKLMGVIMTPAAAAMAPVSAKREHHHPPVGDALQPGGVGVDGAGPDGRAEQALAVEDRQRDDHDHA